MKKHKGIKNPWALAWSMKNKGYKSHVKEETRGRSNPTDETGMTAKEHEGAYWHHFLRHVHHHEETGDMDKANFHAQAMDHHDLEHLKLTGKNIHNPGASN